MRSRASVRGHPLHPALIPFPFAFLTGALLFDLAGWVFAQPPLTATARHLVWAGIAFGVLAAVPGVIDYVASVPPQSSGQRRARRHGLANTAALALFAASLVVRGDAAGPVPAAIGLELAGAGALVYGGWLGGVLVTRNMMGVDHRFANAGKWREMSVDTSSGVVVAAREDELEPGQMKLLHADGRRIALGRTSRGYVAFDDRCSHRGASLAGGVLIGSTVHCLWHGSQFDVESGALRCGPAKEPIRTYRVEVAGGDVRVHLG